MAGKIRGWILDTIWKFKVSDGTVRTVFDEQGYLYQRNAKITASAAEINAISGIGATGIAVLTSAGTAANGDIVIDAPFEPSGMIVQGLSTTGAPVTFDTATYATGKITITVTTGAATDNWSVIIWQ